MRIQLRVRTNDINEARRANQLIHDGFVIFDNCSEVKFGKPVVVSKEEFKILTRQFQSLKESREFLLKTAHAETEDLFEDTIYMVRDIIATEERLNAPCFNNGTTTITSKGTMTIDASNSELAKQGCPIPLAAQKENKSPYHYNVIEWKDRSTGKRYRLIYDTIVFLTDDQGNTIRKIDG